MPLRIPVAVIRYTQTVAAESNLPFKEQLWLQLLDWPMIALAVLLLVLVLFRKQLATLLARGGITLVWGDKAFTISDLPGELDESFSEMVDDMEALRDRLKAVEDAMGKKPAPASAPSELSEEQQKAARKRMISEGLEKSQYRWRSIERLAVIGGVTEAQALDILRSDRAIQSGQGQIRSGYCAAQCLKPAGFLRTREEDEVSPSRFQRVTRLPTVALIPMLLTACTSRYRCFGSC